MDNFSQSPYVSNDTNLRMQVRIAYAKMQFHICQGKNVGSLQKDTVAVFETFFLADSEASTANLAFKMTYISITLKISSNNGFCAMFQLFSNLSS